MTDEYTPQELPVDGEQYPQTYETTPASPVVPPLPPQPVPVRPKRSALGMIVAGIFGGLVGAAIVVAAFVFVLGYPVQETAVQPTGDPASLTTSTPAPVALGEAAFAETVAARLTPSVVYIEIQQTGVDRFTGRTVTQSAGNGSGVIIREDGYILTNNHVVDGADVLLVTIGVEELPATVVGTDPSTDLAVIKVDKTGLPAAEFGSSAALKVGESVVAIGSPFGLEKTVTSGIISALGRSTVAQGTSGITAYISLIQTDAAINPGNSGGALSDAQGRLIGINTLIQSTSGQSAGIGFAIPVDFAKSIAEELIATGRASHPFMGVGTATIDGNAAAQYGLSVSTGAFVQSVTAGSPAETAGIKQGDIIVKVADTDIASVEDVFTAIRSQKVGDTVSVEIVRGEERLVIKVTLASDTAAR
jgi:putative serine protease PepD